MAGSDRLRDPGREAGLFRRRAIIAGIGSLILVMVLLGRLLVLQYFEHQHYTTLSQDNRMRIQAIAPTRGLIFDRDGRVLADNVPNFRLELIPEGVDNLHDTLARLHRYVDFTRQDVARLRHAWRRARPFEGVPLRFRLTREEVARLKVNRSRFPGLKIVAGLSRQYPFASTGEHAVGYVGRIDQRELQQVDADAYRGTQHIGKTGIEAAYESTLHGEPGFRRVEVNAQGRVLRVVDRQAPVPGRDIQLTLSVGLERAAERLLAPNDGAVVALDPRNGQVLALASTPGFDPNRFVDGISHERYARLRDTGHRPLFNRAIRGQYPPGSTVKPFIALNGLNRDARGRNSSIHCRGHYKLDATGDIYNDWKAHGTVDLSQAITQSCDVMFYDLAMQLGMKEMASFLRRFGFDQPTGIDLPGERGGLIPDPSWKRDALGKPWYTGETPIHGIGQGYMQTTPVQLAAAIAQIANRGQPVRPHLELRPEDAVAANRDDAEAGPVVPPLKMSRESDWSYVIQAMVRVTQGDHGTARSVQWRSPNVIAGKTGTAQVFSLEEGQEYSEDEIPKSLRDHGLFIAFAPPEKPRIALAVIVEHAPKGSHTAALVAQKLIDYWLERHPAPDDAAGEGDDDGR